MIGDTLKNIEKTVELLSKKRTYFVEDAASPTAKIFLVCKTFDMLDFISFAHETKKQVFSEKYENMDDGEKEKLLCKLQVDTEKFFHQHIVPYEEAKTHLKRNDENNADDLIFLFWRIPELLPYAPIMTMLALIHGIPYEIFRDTNLAGIDVKDTGKLEVYTKWLCEGLEILIKDWKEHRTNYRSKRYRDKKPFCDAKTLKQDFWQMVLFMKMQQELAKFIQDFGFYEEKRIDLNAFFEDFCDLWPYSPELFLPIDENQSKSVDEWRTMTDLFFEKGEKETLLVIMNQGWPNTPQGWPNTPSVTCEEIWKKFEETWLTYRTPYFVAYYFIDDFKISGMIRFKNKGDLYRKEIINIIQEKRKWIDNLNEGSKTIFEDGKDIPILWKKMNRFDEIQADIWSEHIIQREIDPIYWNILLGIYIGYYGVEDFCDMAPKIRMARFLGLEEETQDTKTPKIIIFPKRR